MFPIDQLMSLKELFIGSHETESETPKETVHHRRSQHHNRRWRVQAITDNSNKRPTYCWKKSK